MANRIDTFTVERVGDTSVARVYIDATVESVSTHTYQPSIYVTYGDESEGHIQGTTRRLTFWNSTYPSWLIREYFEVNLPLTCDVKFEALLDCGPQPEDKIYSEIFEVSNNLGKCIEVVKPDGSAHAIVKYDVSESWSAGHEVETVKYQNADYPVAYVMKGAEQSCSVSCKFASEDEYAALVSVADGKAVFKKYDGTVWNCVLHSVKRSIKNGIPDAVSFEVVRVNG